MFPDTSGKARRWGS